MDFLWRHKWLIFLALCVYLYFRLNPPDRFGIVIPPLVFYDRKPMMFVDVVIKPDGEKIQFYDFNREETQRTICEIVHEISSAQRQTSTTIIIGTGFENDRTFTLPTLPLCSKKRWGIDIIELSSHEAIQRFNSMKDKGESVAIFLNVSTF